MNGAMADESVLRREFPHHKAGVARLNNGSFGSCPSSVLEAQAEWQRRWMEQPDEFYYTSLEAGLRASRAAVASIINAPSAEQVVLVDNATTAAAMVVQQVAWGFTEGRYNRGDAVILLSCAYGAVKKCVEAYLTRAGATTIEVQISLPVHSHEQIVSRFEASLSGAKQPIRLAIIDHISSMPTMVLPVKQLVELCRNAGVDQVFVDGAHAIGNIPVNVDDIGADFYCSDLHKWLFTPHSVAFLHFKPEHNHRLHHPLVSHNYSSGLFLECAWVGTRDYSSQLCVPTALEFIQAEIGGLEKLMKTNQVSVLEMANMLAAAWGTGLGTAQELASSMIMVELPPEIRVGSEEQALELQGRLRNQFKVYNKLEDYVELRDAIAALALGGTAL